MSAIGAVRRTLTPQTGEDSTRRRSISALSTVLLAMATAVFAFSTPAAAYQTAPCDPAGTTSTDAALATQLNSQLRRDMRGYMSAYRVSCARMVVRAVQARGLPLRAATIAVTTTIVETHIQNISTPVDLDSLGLFQQRKSWGTATNRLDPAWATNAFLNKMVSVYPNNSWQNTAVGTVCQAVQVSAYPSRYGEQAGDGEIIASALWSDTSSRADGTLLRDTTDGSVYVLAGGAKFGFNSMAELTAAGYGTNFVNVSHDVIRSLPTVPRDGTALRDPDDGSIYMVAGAAKIGFASWDEVIQAGAQRYVNVPHRHLATMDDEPGDRTLLRNPVTGTVSVMAGGARFDFASPAEVTGGGYGWTQVNVPPRYLATLPVVPRDGTLLRNQDDGTIVVVAGGAKFDFNSPEELEAAGYSWQYVNVPGRFIQPMPTVPSGGSLLYDATDGSIYVVAGGAKLGFRSWVEFEATGYPAGSWVSVAPRHLVAMPDTPADGTLVRGPDSAQVWRVAGGTRMAVTTSGGQPVVVISPLALAAIPVA